MGTIATVYLNVGFCGGLTGSTFFGKEGNAVSSNAKDGAAIGVGGTGTGTIGGER